ncbi:MAG: hypothetical protein JOZ42_06070 [Acetobacteraceae bacterium]|nr:hypothetical protein [Acetobacteraceae bacterium]
MRPALQIFLSGCLTFGVPLLLALRELHALRRHGGDGGWGPDPKPAPETHPKPLPPCLLVAFQPVGKPSETARARELELV